MHGQNHIKFGMSVVFNLRFE